VRAIQSFLILSILFYASFLHGQCDSDDVVHYNSGDFPATLIGGINVAVSGTSYSTYTFGALTASCGSTETNTFIICINETVTFTFLQPIYDLSFAMMGFNMGESVNHNFKRDWSNIGYKLPKFHY
jgi:hypothetical protein